MEEADHNRSVSLSVEVSDLGLLSSSGRSGQTPNCERQIRVDGVPPEAVQVSWDKKNFTRLADLELTVILTEELLHFDKSLLTLSEGLVVESILPLPGHHGYKVMVTATREGAAQASVDAGKLSDLAGNRNNQTLRAEPVIYDVSPPETTRLQGSALDSPGDPTSIRWGRQEGHRSGRSFLVALSIRPLPFSSRSRSAPSLLPSASAAVNAPQSIALH